MARGAENLIKPTKNKKEFLMKKILFLSLLPILALAVDPEVAKKNAEIFGFWTLIPPVVAIVLRDAMDILEKGLQEYPGRTNRLGDKYVCSDYRKRKS